MRIPDDHIATMCGFMAHEAERSLAELRAGNVGDLAASLRDEEAFVRDHMLTWVDDFARCARRSKTAVLYPQMIEALAAFVRNDAVLLSEAACWAEEARDAHGDMVQGGLGALPGQPRGRRLRRGVRCPGGPCPSASLRRRGSRAGEYIGLKSSLVATAKAPCSPSGREGRW